MIEEIAITTDLPSNSENKNIFKSKKGRNLRKRQLSDDEDSNETEGNPEEIK